MSFDTMYTEISPAPKKPKKIIKLKSHFHRNNKNNRYLFALLFGIIGVATLSYSLAAPDNSRAVGGRSARGEVAIEILGNRIAAVAAKNNMSADKLKELFLSDSTLEIDTEDNLIYIEPSVSDTEKKIISMQTEEAQNNQVSAILDSPTTKVAGAVSTSDAFNLNSNLNSTKTIFLDFDGHTTSGTVWNGGKQIDSAAWDLDLIPDSFSTTERQLIIDTWKSVAEDFLPFDVNVTTKDPGTDALKKSSSTDTAYGIRIVISPTSWYSGSAGGVAYVGSFSWNSDTPVFVFTSNIASRYKSIAEASSHEAGHAVGLSHDGSPTSTYYSGHGVWAPIMGVGYYRNVSQWSKGEYSGATNKEDDANIITNTLGRRTDVIQNSISGAKPLTTNAGSFTQYGILETSGDVDMYSLNWAGGPLNISTFSDADVSNISNPADDADISLSLLDSNGTLVAISDPASAVKTLINIDVPAGNYFIEVKGVGYLDALTGYSNYASLGSYVLSGASSTSTSPPPPITNLAPTAKLTATPTSGTAPLSVSFSSNGSTDPEGKPLSYSWNLGNGITSSLANPSTTYSTPGNYTATLTVKDDVGLSSQATTVIEIKALALSMNINSISAEKVIDKQKYALVTIKITDQNGQPVSGISVSGNWSGVISGTSTAITGSDGTVVLRSKTIRKSGTVTFTTTNLVNNSTILVYNWDGVQKSISVVF